MSQCIPTPFFLKVVEREKEHSKGLIHSPSSGERKQKVEPLGDSKRIFDFCVKLFVDILEDEG